MGKRCITLLVLAAPCILLLLPVSLWLCVSQGQQFHQNSFETREPSWVRGTADAPFQEILHTMTDKTAHTGQLSEHIQFTAEQGTFIHYTYQTGRAPIGEELQVSVWYKSNRPGAQLVARLVLPRERNPNNLEHPEDRLLRGDRYQLAGRWQRLSLGSPVKLAREQQQLMRAELKRDVDFSDAYIDNLVLNVYGGPGMTEVWIDDLKIGPVAEGNPFMTTSRPTRPEDVRPSLPAPPVTRRGAVVELNQDQLLVGGKRFFIRGIRYSGTPLETLRDAGFNTLWFDQAVPPQVLEQAVDLGFWLVPDLPVTANGEKGNPLFSSQDELQEKIKKFLLGDAVLFWGLGRGLAHEQSSAVAMAAQAIHIADPQRPLGGDVWDSFRTYSRSLDLIGVHRWPLMTGLELSQYQEWLTRRRLLARPGAFTWTWVQTHLPDWYTNLVYDRPATAGFQEPVGPQPEQVRLLTYSALAAGCRGVGFWSDRFLADSHQGRDRLLTLALLNQELRMLEPLLVTAGTPRWIDTSVPEVKAAVLRTQGGILALPMWLGKGAQFVPGQSAAAQLVVVVPEVPNGTQAWLVSPAEVRSLPSERVAGGMKVTIPEFGMTGAIVFTGDTSPNGLVVRFQDQARRMRKLAAQWAHDLAEVELEKVLRVQGQLQQAGHTLPDAQPLIDQARQRLRASVEHWNNGDFRQAYAEAERTLRPVRILMRGQWEQAVRSLDVPVASPYAVSFFTLPQHWQFWEQIHRGTVGPNSLPDGNFEMGTERAPEGWVKQDTTLDEVQLIARPVSEAPRDGQQCLMLQVKPKGGQALPPEALERTFLAIHSPAVSAQPGSLVQISGWMRIPQPITASPDGALLYDSVGGEPLAVRLSAATAWKKFTLYRRVPASGTVRVSLALTGLGTVYFDDVRIEPLIPGEAGPALAN